MAARHGVLVAIEGIDAAGKKTQSATLVERARKEGLSARLLGFPRYSESHFAGSIKGYLTGRFGGLKATPPEFAALLFAGDRLEGRDSILEALESADLLVCDRYVASNLAHQSARIEDRSKWLAFQHWIGKIEFEIYRIPKPDLTIYLDVPIEVAARTIAERSDRIFLPKKEQDLHETDIQYLAACRDAYVGLVSTQWSERWATVRGVRSDGTRRPVRDVADEIWDAVTSVFHDRLSVDHDSGVAQKQTGDTL